MALTEYRYRRRVQFAETDMAGVVHFSWIARYMEEAEHALWRAAGLSIAPPGAHLVFPRVAVAIEFAAPLRFEEEFEVRVRVEALTRRTIRYTHTIARGDTVIATGTMTAACVSTDPPPMHAIDIPPDIRTRLGDGSVFNSSSTEKGQASGGPKV
jgi:YbgC/YbaW family acyl-CoA thioester hydrolase